MRIPYSNNLVKDILQSKNLTERDLDVKNIEYVVPNVKELDNFLAFNSEIVVFADCDTDGLSAAAICKTYFDTFEGYTVHYEIASRNKRGFQAEDVARCRASYPSATGIITVDCGITSVDAVDLAKHLGFDTLITDHHEPQAELPDCPIINPKLDNRNVFKDFCGAGLIYLCFRQLEGDNEQALQYAAIATVADVVTLLKDNRWIVKNGLKLLGDPMRISKTLLQFTTQTKLNLRTAKDIGWGIGPLINSASRLGKENTALQAFVHGDVAAMQELAAINVSRKTLITDIMSQAENIQLTAHTASIYADTNHVGVLGLLAIKLFSTFGLPSIAYCQTEDSKFHFSIRGEGSMDFLLSLSDSNVEGGGHDSAAGFSTNTDGSIICERYREFYQGRFDRNTESGKFSESIDLADNTSIEIPLVEIVNRLNIKNRLEPFGHGFTEPTFHSIGINISSGGLTSSGKYSKYWIRDGDGTSVVFYDFNKFIRPEFLDCRVSIDYHINYSGYNSNPVIELIKVYVEGEP